MNRQDTLSVTPIGTWAVEGVKASLVASVVAVATLTALPVLAQVSPAAVALDEKGAVRAVLHEHGVTTVTGDRATWNCRESLGAEVSQFTAVGASRLTAWGEGGVVSSDDIGACSWRAMGGIAGIAPVAAVYQPSPGGLELVVALAGETPLRKISHSSDGGATSEMSDALSIAEHAVVALVGHGDDLVLVARHGPTQALRVWRSADLGQSWGDREDATLPAGFVALALGAPSAEGASDGVIVGVVAQEFGVFGADGWTALGTLDGSVVLTAGDHRGRAAIATETSLYLGSAAGLERVGDGGWSALSLAPGASSAIVGRTVSRPDESWVFAVGGTEAPRALASATWEDPFPEVCAAALESRCDQARVAFAEALGVQAPVTVPEPGGESPNADGCQGGGGPMNAGLMATWCLLVFGVGRFRRKAHRAAS